MRRVLWGGLLCLGLATAAAVAGDGNSATHRMGELPDSESGQFVVNTAVTDKVQQIAILDAARQTLAVYHVDLGTGEIALKSVRNLAWDLQLMEFNCPNPQPREIRSMFKQ